MSFRIPAAAGMKKNWNIRVQLEEYVLACVSNEDAQLARAGARPSSFNGHRGTGHKGKTSVYNESSALPGMGKTVESDYHSSFPPPRGW